MELTDYSAVQLRDQLAAGHCSSREITQAFLDRISRLDTQVGAYLEVLTDSALQAAAASDERRAAQRLLSPWDGIPIALKDVLCTKDSRTTCSSRMLAAFHPPYDATVVEHLRRAGLVILGKTNLDEFAMGGSTENGALGKTANPWDLSRVPGGSSGGSAAAMAARLAPWAIGSDTGGSIRQPAAYCGIVGLKPTYGRVSRYGLVAFASSLDQVGPMAGDVHDTAALLELISGADPRDATCVNQPVPPFGTEVRRPLEGLRLGVIRQHLQGSLDEQVGEHVSGAIEQFRKLGARITDVALPHARYAVATYYLIASSEASSNLARYDGVHYGHRASRSTWAAPSQTGSQSTDAHAARTDRGDESVDGGRLVRMYCRSRSEGFGAEVKRRIMLGTYALSAGYYDAYYLKALKVRRLIRQDYDQAFEQADVLIGPTTPTPAFLTGEKRDDPLSMYLQDLYTVSTNLAGTTAMSIPCGFTRQGLPIGLQLQAPPFEELRVLRAAAMYQGVTDWHTRKPELP